MVNIYHCCNCNTTETNIKGFVPIHTNCRDGWGRPLYVGFCPRCGFKYGAEMRNIPNDEDWKEYVINVIKIYYAH